LAQQYPARAVRLVIASSVGSGVDIIGRIIAAEFAQSLGQQFVADNRPGAGTNIAMEIVAHAAPDGYTLLLATPGLAANISLYKKLAFDPVRDFAPISQVAAGPFSICVNSQLPVKSVRELIALAKARPVAVNYASGGTGTASYLAMEMFKMAAGVDFAHVPYKGGGPAMTALMAGETAVFIAPYSNCLPFARQGKVVMLAVTGPRRVPSMPEMPTVAESGLPGYVFESWYGLLAPARTPQAVTAVVYRALTQVLAKPEVNARLGELGFLPLGSSGAVFGAYVRSEIAKYAEVVRRTGVAAD
jgi:tripartite-type tricarboxylate transporter receptor subunit TctC